MRSAHVGGSVCEGGARSQPSGINPAYFPTGCMFEKGPRQFYDDTCVVPEKFDGRFVAVIRVLILERGRGQISLAVSEDSRHSLRKGFHTCCPSHTHSSYKSSLPSLHSETSVLSPVMECVCLERARKGCCGRTTLQWEGSLLCLPEHMQLVIGDLLKTDPVMNKAEQKATGMGWGLNVACSLSVHEKLHYGTHRNDITAHLLSDGSSFSAFFFPGKMYIANVALLCNCLKGS